MGHNHSVHDSDTRFIINPITRQAKCESRKATVIQFDHNSERFTFECPRLIEGHDMSACNRVEVHYINIDPKTKEQNTGVYVADDLRIDPENPEKVVCSWLISQNATQIIGALNFIVCYKCIENGECVYAWNTAISSVSVSDGINASESVATEYADVLEQWRAELYNAGYINASTMQNEMNTLKSRMDSFVALKDGSTTGDAELIDARIGIAGNPHKSAGTAIRSQVKSIARNIDEICLGESINVFWRYANDGNCGRVYRNNTGEIISTSAKYSHTEPIPVTPKQIVTIYTPEPNGNCITMLGACFDADKNVLYGMGMHPNYTSGEAVEYTVPEGVYYLGINYHVDYFEQTSVVPRNPSPWQCSHKGKVWCCIGDSLTEANNRAKKHYFDYIAEDLGISVLNYGVSGTGYKNYSFANRIAWIAEDFDILTIFGSFNDIDADWELGDVSDADTATICGCINKAVANFFSYHPTKKIAIITPTPWKCGISYFGKETTLENMNEYVEALVAIARKNRIPCLDLYHNCGLNPDNERVLSAYFNEDGTQDVGAHPNSKGHEFIYPTIKEFIRSL